jgi:hypothetical protein
MVNASLRLPPQALDMRRKNTLSFGLIGCLVAACASPAPQYFGAARHEVTLEGISFTVFTRDSSAEVIRHGYLTRVARAPVPALMATAAEQASGCQVIPGTMVTGLPGDTGEARFQLRC